MKILVLSNTYPPHFIGGYELACHEVVERLKAAGHQVAVLTSTYGVPAETSGKQKAKGKRQKAKVSEGTDGVQSSRSDTSLLPFAFCLLPFAFRAQRGMPFAFRVERGGDGVYRLLFLDLLRFFEDVPPLSLRERAMVEYHSIRALRRILAVERPDLIYVWNMGGLTRSLLQVAHRYRAPVVYEIFDPWLAQPPDVYEWAEFWQHRPRRLLKRLIKTPVKWLLGRFVPLDLPVIDLRFVSFKSQWLKRTALEAGLPVAEAPVIYHGVDRALFHPADGQGDRETGRHGDRETRRDGCRFLYVGQVVPHKGVHTLIEAFARLAHAPAEADVSLTIVGGGIRPDYIDTLRDTVRSHGLSDRVQFRDLLPRAELPAIYREHDVLICPSIWQEPFGLTQVEAMACGIPVIGTGTGGSAEILTEETALRFPPDDAEALADRMATLATEPDRRRRMGQAALRRVADHFDLDRQVGQTEAFLERALSSRRQSLPRAPWKMPLRAELEGGR